MKVASSYQNHYEERQWRRYMKGTRGLKDVVYVLGMLCGGQECHENWKVSFELVLDVLGRQHPLMSLYSQHSYQNTHGRE